MRDAILTELFAAWKAALADELAPSDWHLNRAHARLRRIEREIVEAPRKVSRAPRCSSPFGIRKRSGPR